MSTTWGNVCNAALAVQVLRVRLDVMVLGRLGHTRVGQWRLLLGRDLLVVLVWLYRPGVGTLGVEMLLVSAGHQLRRGRDVGRLHLAYVIHFVAAVTDVLKFLGARQVVCVLEG